MRAGIQQAVLALTSGGVISYPTEGVFGLGCLPHDISAIYRLLAIKRRSAAKGLILIASDADQLEGWVSASDPELPAADSNTPTTWIVSPGERSHALLQGEHSSLAVRLTTNPVAYALCAALGSPIISTSANFSGRPVARNAYILRRQFGSLVDYVAPGRCGPASGPSTIRILATGQTIRPAN